MTDFELMTEAEAAVALGLKARTLRAIRRRGQISFKPIGRLVRYRRRDLVEFLERDVVEARGN